MAPLVVACSFHQLPDELHRKILMLAASAQPQILELDEETARSIRGVSRRWAAVGVELASQIRVPFDYAKSRSLKHLRALLLKAPQVDFLDANIGRGYHKTLMGILGEHEWRTLTLQRHAQDDRVWASSGLTLRSLSSTNVGACVIKQGLKRNHSSLFPPALDLASCLEQNPGLQHLEITYNEQSVMEALARMGDSGFTGLLSLEVCGPRMDPSWNTDESWTWEWAPALSLMTALFQNLGVLRLLHWGTFGPAKDLHLPNLQLLHLGDDTGRDRSLHGARFALAAYTGLETFTVPNIRCIEVYGVLLSKDEANSHYTTTYFDDLLDSGYYPLLRRFTVEHYLYVDGLNTIRQRLSWAGQPTLEDWEIGVGWIPAMRARMKRARSVVLRLDWEGRVREDAYRVDIVTNK